MALRRRPAEALRAKACWLAAAFTLCAVIVSLRAQTPEHLPFPPVATFSILGYDPDTGEAGGAVQSRVFSVGNGVLWAEPLKELRRVVEKWNAGRRRTQ